MVALPKTAAKRQTCHGSDMTELMMKSGISVIHPNCLMKNLRTRKTFERRFATKRLETKT